MKTDNTSSLASYQPPRHPGECRDPVYPSTLWIPVPDQVRHRPSAGMTMRGDCQ
ncbi:MAG: hypothetical protein KME41_13045 [Candidatus Thiodiazotropha sp. (ex Lucina pensylvanica)]|nr:hypothetical protein [Candidatus Thiodiazotropha sp. (ex Lucina pensylvanica)]MBT3037752.1 hypothetical protein [Candidatus Thiodiazotropha sp. (ex Codakia orbicularis)]